MAIEDDFPIGCEVELIKFSLRVNDKERFVGTKAKVIKHFKTHSDDFLIIDWGDCVDKEGDARFPWRFKRIDNIKPVNNNPAFCSCASPNIINNSVLGKTFLYCRSCKKERGKS